METLTLSQRRYAEQAAGARRSEVFRGEPIEQLRYCFVRSYRTSALLMLKSAGTPRRTLLITASRMGAWTAERSIADGDEVYMEALVTDKLYTVWPDFAAFFAALAPWLEDEWDGPLSAALVSPSVESLLRFLPAVMAAGEEGIHDASHLAERVVQPLDSTLDEWEGTL